jgi:hypothetical protein
MSKAWTTIVEAHGIRVRLFERGGVIYRAVGVGRTVSVNGTPRTKQNVRSLKHGDRELAEEQAAALCAELALARLTGTDAGHVTLRHVFSAYRTHRLPSLSKERQREANSLMAMFSEAWGGGLMLADLDQTRVDLYVRKRRAHEVLPPAMRPDENGKRRRGYRTPRPLRDGALDADFRWLSSAFAWAVGYRTNGRRMLRENPLRGLKWPREANPLRPVAAHQRYIATQGQTDTVDSKGRLRCILALARHTGRRESALCALWASDLLLSPDRVRRALADAGMDERLAEHMPHGGVRWRAEEDKKGFLFISPISREMRAELDLYMRRSARLGDVPLFPGPGRKPKKNATPPKEPPPEKPISRDTVSKWLLRAEAAAELPKLRGGAFHPYRRLWATERKHMPDADVAAAGGWKDTQALRLSYQHADPATVLRVVEGA